MVIVVLPQHLRKLAQVGQEVRLEVSTPVSVSTVLTELETTYPVLRGTIREHETLKRRPFVRFFACGEDISHEPAELELPDSIATGREPLLVVGAIAGG